MSTIFGLVIFAGFCFLLLSVFDSGIKTKQAKKQYYNDEVKRQEEDSIFREKADRDRRTRKRHNEQLAEDVIEVIKKKLF